MTRSREGLWEALQDWRLRGRLWAHVPAHRGGAGAPVSGRSLLDLRLDATELPELDDLSQPTGVIAAAQKRAAAYYGAAAAHFLVGGVTAGLQAAILATVGPGETLVLPRTAHRSVLAGLILTGARPRFVWPVLDPTFGLPLGVLPDVWSEALPGATAVLTVDPSYHGVATDIKALAEAAHAQGLPLIVDAAHGATFGQEPSLPASALAQGADIVVLGLHKSGGSPTQTALLLVQGELVDRDRLRESLNLIQTSSPSYVLLAGLDLTVRWWPTAGKRSLRRSLETARVLRERSPWPVFAPQLGANGVSGWDPTRLTLRVSVGGWEGPAALERLRELGVEPEYADLENVLFCLGLGAGRREGERLRRAWEELGYRGPALDPPRAPTAWPVAVLGPREAHFARAEEIPLAGASGRILARSLVPYPPGSPVLYPGEVLSLDWEQYLRELLRKGRTVRGLGSGETVRVVSDGG